VVEAASVVVVASMAAAVAFMEEVLVVAVSAVALWLPGTLEAESACAAVESPLEERASQAAFRTLPAQGRDSLQWGIHHPGSLWTMDGLIGPLLPVSRPIMAQWLQPPVRCKHFRNAE
jgi:hypothetical protein